MGSDVLIISVSLDSSDYSVLFTLVFLSDPYLSSDVLIISVSLDSSELLCFVHFSSPIRWRFTLELGIITSFDGSFDLIRKNSVSSLILYVVCKRDSILL